MPCGVHTALLAETTAKTCVLSGNILVLQYKQRDTIIQPHPLIVSWPRREARHAASKDHAAPKHSSVIHRRLHTVRGGSRAIHDGRINHLHRKLGPLPVSAAAVSTGHRH